MKRIRPLRSAVTPLLGLCILCAPEDAARGQQQDSPSGMRVTFLPGRSPVLPLTAPEQEPRMGIRKEIGSSKLILDIGSTFDIVGFSAAAGDDATLRAGIDFFTYALSTSIAGRRLQIDAVDGYFGGHLLFHQTWDRSDLTIRLRILHRSAHFIDGHYDNTLQQWRDNRPPNPFTRDFGELLLMAGTDIRRIHLSGYSGISYSTLARPDELRRIGTLHGLELTSGDLLGDVLDRSCTVFAAFNFSLDGVPVYVGTSTLVLGAKFGEWSGQGIRVILGYRSGLEIFGQYFDVRREYWTLGLLFDVW